MAQDKIDNPFDRHLELWGSQIPSAWREAAIDARDTLHLAALACDAEFGEGKYTPSDAIEVLKVMVQLRIEAERADHAPDED
jgi:hypothetical protein